jgi:hypothetical protein
MSEEREPYLSDSEIVRAIAGRPLDDAVREQAIRDLRVVPLAELVDDYEFAIRQAGDLGGVELV